MTSDVARMIRLARDQARLTTLDYATQLFDDFIELHGDRNFRDDEAVVGGIGFLAGRPVTVIGIQKGKSLQDNLNRNFGQPHPEGYRKAGAVWSPRCYLHQYCWSLSRCWCRGARTGRGYRP